MTVTVADRRLATFDAFDELVAQRYGDDLIDIEITDELVADVVTLSNQILDRDNGDTHDILRATTWLKDPQRFSPHIDEIAVERAVALEWDVIDALTHEERKAVSALLAVHYDPFGMRGSMSSGGNQWAEFEVSPSARRMAFELGTEKQRESLAGSVRAASRV